MELYRSKEAKKQKTINNIRTTLFNKIDEELNSMKIQKLHNKYEKVNKEFSSNISQQKNHKDKITKKEDQKDELKININPNKNKVSFSKNICTGYSSNLNQEDEIMNHDSSNDESFSESDQDERFIIIYLHFLMNQENTFIEINNSKELENKTEKIIEFLGSDNKKTICDSIKFLHCYCDLFKKRSTTKIKKEKYSIENNKKIHKKILKKHTKYKLKKNEIDLYCSPKKEKKSLSKKNNGFLTNNNHNDFKIKKSENIKKLLYNLKAKKKVKYTNSNVITDTKIINKTKEHQKISDRQSLFSSCQKNKQNSPSNSNDSSISKKNYSQKRNKNKKQTAQCFISEKFQANNFYPDKNEFVKSKRKSTMGFTDLRIKNNKSKSKEKKKLKSPKKSNNESRGSILTNYKKIFHKENTCLTEKTRKNYKTKKHRSKNIRMSIINSNKTSKGNKCEHNYFSNNTEITKHKKKQDSNISVLSEYDNIKTEAEENLSDGQKKQNNYQVRKKINSKIFLNGFNNSDDSFTPECYNNYNEEGMDELLFTKKVKRKRKIVIN